MTADGERDRESSRGLVGRLVVALLVGVIQLYRWVVSPLLGARCRFEPSCSAYARDAILHYGPLAGSWRALKRLGRCHPFHPGGYDPPVRGS